MSTDHGAAARALEEHLGDPLDGHSPLSFARAVEGDEQDTLPDVAWATLEGWGLAAFYVPVPLGGRLGSGPEIASLLRVVSRRDLGLALAHAAGFLGALPVWMAGSAGQQQHFAGLVLSGRTLGLVLGETSVMPAAACMGHGHGHALTGRLEFVLNAPRCAAVVVPAGGGLAVLDEPSLRAIRTTPPRRLRLHGIRGCEVAALDLSGVTVPDAAWLGGAHANAAPVLRATRDVLRILAASMWAGLGATAFSATLDFARRRRLYGTRVLSMPFVRRALSAALAELLACECVSLVAARALSLDPRSAGHWGALCAAFVMPTVARVIRELSVILGARSYLRGGHWAGVFEKLRRDSGAMRLLDPREAAGAGALRSPAGCDSGASRLLYDLSCAAPALEPRQLIARCDAPDPTIVAGGLAGFDFSAAAAADSTLKGRSMSSAMRSELADLIRTFECHTHQLQTDLAAHPEEADERLAALHRYGSLQAAGVCLQLWATGGTALDPFAARGAWLVQFLQGLFAPGRDASASAAAMAEELEAQAQAVTLLSS